MSEQVLVVPRTEVAANAAVQGFRRVPEEFVKWLVGRGVYMPRDAMEQDPSYKQLIPYVVITDHAENVFVYTRTKKQGEQRLHGRRSLGVGGHICSEDQSAGDPYLVGLARELQEELHLEDYHTSQFVGLVNDETNDVGAVHLGIVHRISVPAGGFCTPKDPEEMAGSGFFAKSFLCDELDSFETWSQILIREWLCPWLSQPATPPPA